MDPAALAELVLRFYATLEWVANLESGGPALGNVASAAELETAADVLEEVARLPELGMAVERGTAVCAVSAPIPELLQLASELRKARSATAVPRSTVELAARLWKLIMTGE